MIKLIKPNVKLLNISHENPEKFLEQCGRICYKSENKITDDSANKFIINIMKRGHLSVIEHVSTTFKITCSRAISHELVRHRVASFSQESTRYCDYSGEVTFIIPPEFKHIPCGKYTNIIFDNNDDDIGFDLTDIDGKHKKLFTQDLYSTEFYWLHTIFNNAINYVLIRKCNGVESAREVLPNSTKTELIMTANLREWLHVIKMRYSKAANSQVKEISGEILDILAKKIPSIFNSEYKPLPYVNLIKNKKIEKSERLK